MWPFKRSWLDTADQQASSAEPAWPRVQGRWRRVMLLSFALLIIAFLGVFWVDRSFWTGDDRLTGTVWKEYDL